MLHRTTLVFVNTRRMAERAARHLGELLGKEAVAAHHGSLAKETRLDAEQRLKRGELKVLVATASLELGLDIGDVDLVCQLGSPRSIADLPAARRPRRPRGRRRAEGAALSAVARRAGRMRRAARLRAPRRARRAARAAGAARRAGAADRRRDRLPRVGRGRAVRAGAPRLALRAADARATSTPSCACSPKASPRARASARSYVHRDAVHHLLRERKGARLTALTSGGTIPETGDYTVVLEPQAHNDRHRQRGLRGREPGRRRLPARQHQLPHPADRARPRAGGGRARRRAEHPVLARRGAGAQRRAVVRRVAPARARSARRARRRDGRRSGRSTGCTATIGIDDEGGAPDRRPPRARRCAALGALPTQQRIVMERFFDASGGMQLVIHSPFGSRLNRAWGLALRKRFCRQFNFELQAAATEDAIVLSLSTSHSFPLDEVARYLHSATALDVLVQALLDAPLFGVRWRWNATTALALPRFVGGRKVAPQLQRMKSEDLLAVGLPGPGRLRREPRRRRARSPTIRWSRRRCTTACTRRWTPRAGCALLRGIESGEIEVLARDLPAPSPLAAEALNARPYAFLDDAPLEERRTQAVQNRRYGDPRQRRRPGPPRRRRDRRACARKPGRSARNADEMHEALIALGVVTDAEAAGERRLAALARDARRGGPGDAAAPRDDGSAVGRGRAPRAGRARSIPTRDRRARHRVAGRMRRRPARRATRPCASCCARASAASGR